MQHRITNEQQPAADALSFEHPQYLSLLGQLLPRFSVTGMLLAALLCASPVLAGSYEIIQGKGQEVCEAYAKNLNSFNPAEPMLCERPVNPALKDFSKPKWKELTLDEIAMVNAELADRVSSMITRDPSAPKVPMSEWVRKARLSIATNFNDSWPLSMWRTSIDLDNNGKSETLAKEIHGKCDRLPYPVVLLRPIGSDALGSRLTQIIDGAQHRIKDGSTGVSAGSASMSGQERLGAYTFPDAFRHKGEWYLDIGAIAPTDRGAGRLHVLKHRDGTTSEVCQFHFRYDKN